MLPPRGSNDAEASGRDCLLQSLAVFRKDQVQRFGLGASCRDSIVEWYGLGSSVLPGSCGHPVAWGGGGVATIKSEPRRIVEPPYNCSGGWELPSQLIYGGSSKILVEMEPE